MNTQDMVNEVINQRIKFLKERRCSLCDHKMEDHYNHELYNRSGRYEKCHYPLVTVDGTMYCPCRGWVDFELSPSPRGILIFH
jgi:hypothetical protein